MGIRFNTNTWRAPLLLIDCWLPLQPSRVTAPRAMPLFLQRFARAGWLKPAGSSGAQAKACPSSASRQITGTPPHARFVRVHSVPDIACPNPVSDGRLALSGRMGDVCAELDRLAALEHMLGNNASATT